MVALRCQSLVGAGGRALFSLSRTRALRPSPLQTSCQCLQLHLFPRRSRFVAFCCETSVIAPVQPRKIFMENSIHISTLEEKIFDTLKAVLIHFELKTQLRVAGGWVRDKLLGKESHDIDIALEDMHGKSFCERVNEYLMSINEETKHYCVIQSNPDQSKHLETARMKVFGVEIDFVNLRAENYAEESRIPTMKFGSAKEDAYRRDLTINSLFYNINTGLIEDFTGRGLSDLRNGVIATPLPPKTTFLDDPLRVLRAIRFAARFNYKIQEELKVAAMDVDVGTALEKKVSPERVGVEIDLMMTGADPVRAIQELIDVNIFWIILRLPQELEDEITDSVKRSCLGALIAMMKVLAVFGPDKLTTDQRRLALYSALFLPFKSFKVTEKKRQVPLTHSLIKHSLKLKTHDALMVTQIHEAADEFNHIWKVLFDEENGNINNSNQGARDWELTSRSEKMIRAGFWMGNIKELWRVALVLHALLDVITCTDLGDTEVKQRAGKCLAAEAAIMELGLEDIWNVKPLLDGKKIMSALGLEKGIPGMKEWQNHVRKWQLCHMTATAEECYEWLKDEYQHKRQRLN
ncbi:hypothetical protein KP509_14G043600 [Ceratopteris richardii]|uniref:Poly A polymerase head domain-containing protein n=1 Tax=Ceratopteris richardii TaxID=49495 RepID=A0A8T2TEC7_CERRI|nr:hypothetical protein KP509_14G043600 [Ceratopteris richardii]